MSDINESNEHKILAYLEGHEVSESCTGFSDRALASWLSLSAVEVALASQALHKRGLVERYDHVIDESAFGGTSHAIACTKLRKPIANPYALSPERFRAYCAEHRAAPHRHSRAMHDAINARMSWSVPYQPITLDQEVAELVAKHGASAVLQAVDKTLTPDQREAVALIDADAGEYSVEVLLERVTDKLK